MVEIPYCKENENASKHFIEKFEIFTNHRYRIAIKWITKSKNHCLKLKSKNPHPSCVIYRGKCSCGEEYIGETEINVEKRWSEHSNPTEETEPVRHLSNNIGDLFAWEILTPAPKEKRTRKNLEAFFMMSGHFPDGYIPDQTHPRRTFPRWTLPRPDTSPTDISPTDTSPTRHPQRTFPRRTLPRTDTFFSIPYSIVTYLLIVIFIYIVH